MNSEDVKFEEIIPEIFDHVISCDKWETVCCYSNPSKFNDVVVCNCGKEWKINNYTEKNVHWINERLLVLIKERGFRKDNVGVQKMLELYKKAKCDKEIKDNIQDKMNILYNIDIE
jgi:hypothetical protein